MTEPCVVLLPSYDGTYDGLLMRGLIQVITERPGKIVDYWTCTANSVTQFAREDAVHWFLTETRADWCVFIDADIGFTLEDWDLLWSDPSVEVAHVSYHAKTQLIVREAELGLGFTRISRRLFEEIDALQHEDGTPMAARYFFGGTERVEYFPQGARVHEGHRVAEDHGFWTFARLTGARLCVEKGGRLVHSGKARWYGGFPDPLRPDPQSIDVHEGKTL